ERLGVFASPLGTRLNQFRIAAANHRASYRHASDVKPREDPTAVPIEPPGTAKQRAEPKQVGCQELEPPFRSARAWVFRHLAQSRLLSPVLGQEFHQNAVELLGLFQHKKVAASGNLVVLHLGE